MIRTGLRTVLERCEEVALVREAPGGEEALTLLAEQSFDLLLLDFRMPGLSGVPLLKRISSVQPDLRVLVFNCSATEEEIFSAFQAGALGYITKDSDREEILEAMLQVHRGHRWLPTVIAGRYVERLQRNALTVREQELLQLLAAGMDNHSAADVLGISESTVRNRMTGLLSKLEAHDRLQAVIFALRRGLILWE